MTLHDMVEIGMQMERRLVETEAEIAELQRRLAEAEAGNVLLRRVCEWCFSAMDWRDVFYGADRPTGDAAEVLNLSTWKIGDPLTLRTDVGAVGLAHLQRLDALYDRMLDIRIACRATQTNCLTCDAVFEIADVALTEVEE